MPTREYAGAAKRTALVGDITASSTTITVSDATGYPTGATGPFAVAFELGVAAEEKVLVASRSGNTLTVASGGRGYDGTTASAHSSGATVDHVLTATDIREANTHINATVGAHAATAITFTPTTGIAATTVQAAIAELESDANAAYVARSESVEAWAEIGSDQGTTSTAYVDLTTVGPVVSVTVPSSGKVRIDWGAEIYNTFGRMSFALSGANTLAAADGRSVLRQSGGIHTVSSFIVLTGLTPGATTVTAKYRAPDGTAAQFVFRRLGARPVFA